METRTEPEEPKSLRGHLGTAKISAKATVNFGLAQADMAMGQNPNRTPSEHTNPTTKIGSKMLG